MRDKEFPFAVGLLLALDIQFKASGSARNKPGILWVPVLGVVDLLPGIPDLVGMGQHVSSSFELCVCVLDPEPLARWAGITAGCLLGRRWL